ncbi:DUF4286 family protein [Azorhizobium doebereinerae]|uniref:DUF4286 family protein n=1 Tax=Azorhizobium doebereinerae TaxID=281091 RepID=UPI00041E54FD|nr:DUF4286 family protein [Azorhizobium doebereinerae]
MTTAKGLLLVTMEPPAGLEEEFNDWYDTEHFPQRRALPGFETASRWVCLDGWPRWLALYDLASPAALETADYRAVSAGNSTPWSRRLLPRTLGRQRVVAEQMGAGDALTRPAGEAAALLAARYRPDGGAEAFAATATAAAALLPGLIQLRLFRQAGPGAETVWLIAEFAGPVSREALRAALGTLSGAGAQMFNLYAPYFRG